MANKLSKVILKSIGIFGGVQIVSIVCTLLRTKLIAVTLGAVGVGVFSLFNVATDLIYTIASLGIRNSSVRELSIIRDDDNERRRCLMAVIRRWTLWTGLLGMVIMIVFAPMLSRWSFGEQSHMWSFVGISVVLLLISKTRGEEAILQGTRQLGRLSRASMIGNILGVVVCVPLLYMFGIYAVECLVVAWALLNWLTLTFANWRSPISSAMPSKPISARQTWREGMGFVRLGVYMSLGMGVGFLADYIFVSYLNITASTSEVGYYQAGYNIVNRYADMLFAAMAMDFYPRLARYWGHKRGVEVVFTKQLNITLSMLTVAIPVLLLVRELVVELLYSQQFLSVVPYVGYAAVGTLFKAISWCMAFVVLVGGNGKLYLLTETLSAIATVICNVLGWRYWGLDGLGVMYAVNFIIYTIIMYVCYRGVYSLRVHRSSITIAVLALLICITTLFVSDSGVDMVVQIAVAVAMAMVGIMIFLRVYRK